MFNVLSHLNGAVSTDKECFSYDFAAKQHEKLAAETVVGSFAARCAPHGIQGTGSHSSIDVIMQMYTCIINE